MSKDVLGMIIKATTEAVQPATIKELMDLMTDRTFEVIRRNGDHGDKLFIMSTNVT